MPNTKSAIRRVRRVKKQTQVNRIRKSKFKNAIKHIEKLIAAKEIEKVGGFVDTDCSKIDDISINRDDKVKILWTFFDNFTVGKNTSRRKNRQEYYNKRY